MPHAAWQWIRVRPLLAVALSSPPWCVAVRYLRPSYGRQAVLDVFRVLDVDNTRRICVREFLQLADLVRMKDRAKLKIVRRYGWGWLGVGRAVCIASPIWCAAARLRRRKSSRARRSGGGAEDGDDDDDDDDGYGCAQGTVVGPRRRRASASLTSSLVAGMIQVPSMVPLRLHVNVVRHHSCPAATSACLSRGMVLTSHAPCCLGLRQVQRVSLHHRLSGRCDGVCVATLDAKGV